MTVPRVEDVGVTVVPEHLPGDDTVFVWVRAPHLTGWYGPVPAAVAPLVLGALGAAAVGTPVTDHRALYHRLCRAADECSDSGAAAWAVGAVDCAAWDAHAVAEGVSVAALLTAHPAGRVPAYASCLSVDLADAQHDAFASRGGAGWAFTKWALRRRAGDDDASETAERFSAAVGRASEALGAAVAIDAGRTWDHALSARFCEVVDAAALVWVEDPVRTHTDHVYATVRGALPVAVGEHLGLNEDEEQVVAHVSPVAFIIDVVASGGLTRSVNIVRSMTKRGISVYPHGRSFVPGVHLAAAFPATVAAVEFRLRWEPHRQRQYDQPWEPSNGAVEFAVEKGLGAGPRRFHCQGRP